MITNFEEYTEELSDEEIWLIPILIKSFKKIDDKSKAIKAPEIIKRINEWSKSKDICINISEPRFRKCCNFIRSNSLIPLIATSKGYYCSYNQLEIESQIKSLEERANSIINCAEGMKKFIINKN